MKKISQPTIWLCGLWACSIYIITSRNLEFRSSSRINQSSMASGTRPTFIIFSILLLLLFLNTPAFAAARPISIGNPCEFHFMIISVHVPDAWSLYKHILLISLPSCMFNFHNILILISSCHLSQWTLTNPLVLRREGNLTVIVSRHRRGHVTVGIIVVPLQPQIKLLPDQISKLNNWSRLKWDNQAYMTCMRVLLVIQ